MYCRTEVKLPFESGCVFSVWSLVWGFFWWRRVLGVLFGFFVRLVLFFNPDLVRLLEVCTVPAGLATFSIVFVGLQTSILCFPYVVFISRFDSKIRHNACSN